MAKNKYTQSGSYKPSAIKSWLYSVDHDGGQKLNDKIGGKKKCQ